MSFLSGIGRAIRAPGFGDRLQAALAAAGGDTQAITRLHALQRQQQAEEEARGVRDAQVIGAKNLGIGNDEIGALSPEDLSWLARQRIAAPQFDPGAGLAGWEDEGAGLAAAGTGVATPPESAPGGVFKPIGMPGVFKPIGMRGGAGDDRIRQMPARLGKRFPPGLFPHPAATPGSLPRAGSPDHAAALPNGTLFIAPDGSIRRKI